MSARRAPTSVRPSLPVHLWTAIGLLALSFAVQLYVRTDVLRLGYALEQERQTAERLRAEHARLELERTVRLRDDELAARARAIGMRLATPDDVVRVAYAGERR